MVYYWSRWFLKLFRVVFILLDLGYFGNSVDFSLNYDVKKLESVFELICLCFFIVIKLITKKEYKRITTKRYSIHYLHLLIAKTKTNNSIELHFSFRFNNKYFATNGMTLRYNRPFTLAITPSKEESLADYHWFLSRQNSTALLIKPFNPLTTRISSTKLFEYSELTFCSKTFKSKALVISS